MHAMESRPVNLSMRPRVLRAALAIAMNGVGPAGLALAGDSEPCPYTVTWAGTAAVCGVPWSNSILTPQGLNDHGHWVGWRLRCPPQDWTRPVALRWTPETGVVTLPEPPQTSESTAYDINNSGVVVGYREGYTNGVLHGHWACIWFPDGQFVEIPPLGGSAETSSALAVNNLNTVVGERWIPTPLGLRRAAFIWQDGQIIDIDPTVYNQSSAIARDVSDTGYVVGNFGDSNVSGRAFRWKDGQVTVLPLLPGAIASGAYGVTNDGYVAGHCRFQSGTEFTSRATLWSPAGIPVELPPLPGYSSWSSIDINTGVILGSVSKPIQSGLPPTQSVVWLDGVPFALNPLIAPPPQQIGKPAAVNQLGQIVGNGYVPPVGGGGAWVLTPTGSIADINGDCEVNGADLMILLQQWGAVPDAAASADLNHDGMVNGADLAIVLGRWTAL